MNDLIIKENEQLKGLEESKAQHIKVVFDPMMDKLVEVEEAYNNVVSLELTPKTCVLAKRMRLDISKIRIEAGKIKDAQKKEILIAGNAIQGIYNIIRFAVESKEDKLKNIELHYEKIEEEKKAKLHNDRKVELTEYDGDSDFVDYGSMPDEVWNNYLAGVKNNFEAIKEAERKAEADRIEAEKKQTNFDERLKALLIYGDFFDSSKLTIDSTENDFEQIIMDAKTGRTKHLKKQEEIRLENERLKIEADKVEKKRIAEQKKIGRAKAIQDEKLRAEREKVEAEKRIQDEIIRKEREAKEKLERQIEENEAVMLRIEKEKSDNLKAEQKKAKNAPDKEKLDKLIIYMEEIGKGLKGDEAKEIVREAYRLIKGFSKGL